MDNYFGSVPKQNNWGDKKQSQLNQIIQKLIIIPIEKNDVIKSYGDIDAYSQGKLKDNPLPQGMSARNMGKNDL